jgi:hypothetical protein
MRARTSILALAAGVVVVVGANVAIAADASVAPIRT